MPRFFTRLDSTILHAGRPVETIDIDRVAYAVALTAQLRCSPLQAHLVAVRGWDQAIAKAYALLGNDGGAALTRHEAVTAGYLHGLFV